TRRHRPASVTSESGAEVLSGRRVRWVSRRRREGNLRRIAGPRAGRELMSGGSFLPAPGVSRAFTPSRVRANGTCGRREARSSPGGRSLGRWDDREGRQPGVPHRVVRRGPFGSVTERYARPACTRTRESWWADHGTHRAVTRARCFTA